MGELVGAVSAGGPKILAASIVFVGALRFVRWVIEFSATRGDVEHKRLARRLEHVEQELSATREALMLMINRAAEKTPDDPVLREVARILATIAPRPKLDLDEIVRGLNAIPATGGKS